MAKLRLTVPIMMRWCAATEIWRRDHYDKDYAVTHVNLPNVIGSGSWSRSFLYAFVSNWAGLDGWVLKLSHQNRGQMLPGDEYTVWGRVASRQVNDGLGYIELDLGMRKQDGTEAVPARAVVILPVRGGPPVPYPFHPSAEDAAPTRRA